jgi:glycosyltransferase involved in cell wall biosynthesis
MNAKTMDRESGSSSSDRVVITRERQRAPIRAAILCDFAEEGWPSMDLVGDMLSRNLAERGDLEVSQVRPAMQRRFSRAGVLKDMAWNADRLLNRFADYPRWARANRKRFDLFHIVDHSYSQLVHSLPPERTVVTCHDPDTFRCLLEPAREPRPAWFRAMAKRILTGMQMAAHVITVSAATRDELLRHGLIPAERMTVIPNGVEPSCSPEPNPASDEAAARLLGIADGTPILLNVGSTIPRKRLDVLLQVFAKVKEQIPDVRLVRVGGLTPQHMQIAKDLGIEDAVIIVRSLDRATLAAVYRRAWLLLQTSDAEGFGLPVIEAMACGCPVVASDIAVLHEAGGPATAYCGVAEIAAWRETVCRLLSERIQGSGDSELRRTQALEWSRRFSWAENARQTALVYKQVAASWNK